MIGLHNNSFNNYLNSPYSRSAIALPTTKDLMAQSGQLFDSLWEDSMVLRDNLYNIEDDVKLLEEADKYIISFKDEDIANKEMKVDYSKEQNELHLRISQNVDKEEETGYQHYSNTYESSIKFEKAVNGDDLLAEIDGSNVTITVPKVQQENNNTN